MLRSWVSACCPRAPTRPSRCWPTRRSPICWRTSSPEVLADLPELQRVALDRVLLRTGTEGPPTDQRVTGSAVAAVISALAARQPILLAIDDAQWLDVSSRAVLSFAAPRLAGRVGILITARAHATEADPAHWLHLATPEAVGRVRVGPLSLSSLHTMILERFGKAFPRPTMVRIAEVSGGNPFYALELARGVDGRSAIVDSALPSTLTELVRLRTQHFDGEVGDMLLAACSVTDPTVDLLARAAGVPVERVAELLDGPEREGIVRLDGEHVRFAHPLLARGIYTHAGPVRRRRMHRRLADVEEQPELKARHMALGSSTADPDTLAALDEAAAAAIERGAAAAAADLYELAIGLGGDTSARRLSAAEQHLRAGDSRRARGLIEAGLDRFEVGSTRAAGLTLLGAARMGDYDYAGALPLLELAIAEPADDLAVLVEAQLWRSRAQSMTGDRDAAKSSAHAAVVDAERCGEPKLISQAIALRVMLDCAHGGARDEAAMRRALDLEVLDPDVSAPFRASVTDAVTKSWMGRLDEALVGLIAARRRCVEMGSDSDLVYVAGHLSMAYIWLGRYSVAADVAQDVLRRGENIGGGLPGRHRAHATRAGLGLPGAGTRRPGGRAHRDRRCPPVRGGLPRGVAADHPRLPRTVTGQARGDVERVGAAARQHRGHGCPGHLPDVVHARRGRGDGRARSARGSHAPRRGDGGARCRIGPSVDHGRGVALPEHAARRRRRTGRSRGHAAARHGAPRTPAHALREGPHATLPRPGAAPSAQEERRRDDPAGGVDHLPRSRYAVVGQPRWHRTGQSRRPSRPRLRPDPVRVAGGTVGGGRNVQQGHRFGAVHQPQDRRAQSQQRVPQAGRANACRIGYSLK